MSKSGPSSKDVRAQVRALPAVHELAGRLDSATVGRDVATEIARRTIEAARAAILDGAVAQVDVESLAAAAAEAIGREARPPLRSVVNATGIIVHTGLGRAPMSERAAEAIAAVARGATPVELDVASGARGRRIDLVRGLLCELTGAESATVVNNCAAALLITLSTLARGRSVIVSRGELVEIGGSFRLPEVIENGGARLREVGTTNRVRLSDFERAVDGDAAAILRVHASNFRIEGFTLEVELAELVALGRREGLPVIHDIGSGLLRRSELDVLSCEPDARRSIEAGADLVMFSGDKLLGGPQAGVIVGRRELVEQIERNPLMRALRVDKLTLAGLGVTLQLHRDRELAMRELPVFRMITQSVEDLRERAESLSARLGAINGVASARVIETTGYVGGGSNPAQAIASVGVAVRAAGCGEDELARRLRLGGVFGRIEGGEVVFDVRTIGVGLDDEVARVLSSAV